MSTVDLEEIRFHMALHDQQRATNLGYCQDADDCTKALLNLAESDSALIKELYEYAARVENALTPWLLIRSYMVSLPGTHDSRAVLREKIKARLGADTVEAIDKERIAMESRP